MNNSTVTIEQLDDHVWSFDDQQQNSFYVLEGSEKALVIDTGMAEKNIIPLIRQVTQKPLLLALTHAHIDHMYHCDEFSAIYLHEKDKQAWKWPLRQTMWFVARFLFHKTAKVHRMVTYSSLYDYDTISLGDIELKVLPCPGHTPGSVLFVDDQHQLIFSGDALGSGAGVFLWMPGCLSISSYHKALTSLLLKLKGKEHYRFLGGHRYQGKPYSTRPDAFVLGIDLVKDMSTLCEMILQNKITPAAKIKKLGFQILWFHYESAGIAVTKGKIK